MKKDPAEVERPRRATWLLTLGKLSAIALFIILANIGVSRLDDTVEIQIRPQHLEILDRAVLVGVILYVAPMATPFLPGIELGLALMILPGPKGILVTTICTLVARTMSFGLGRLIPAHVLVSFLSWLHLTRAAALVRSFDGIPPEERLQYLAERSAKRAVPILMRHRYLFLTLLLKLPGTR